MTLKLALKNSIARNTYLNSVFYKTLVSSNAKKMTDLMRVTRQFDCIGEIDSLKSFRRQVADGRCFSNKDANLSDARVYGIWRSLFPRVDEKRAFLTPSVEHGLILHDQVFPDIVHSGRCAAITMSPWRRDIIRKHCNIPVFCCGPYVQYADPWYSDEKYAQLKGRLGRTLLVFPCHSTDSSNLSMDEKRYLGVVHEMSQEYDSVLVNAFWWNINDPIMEEFKKRSYRIVSAGFRDDPCFMRRLKSIIMLSDSVVGDSIGTHIGYCVELGKRFQLIDVGTKETLLSERENSDRAFRDGCLNEIRSVFAATCESQKAQEAQRRIAEKYWGYGIRLTDSQLAIIEEFTARLTRECRGFVSRAAEQARKIVDRGEFDEATKLFLRDAIGD